jgi:hypothetical protein
VHTVRNFCSAGKQARRMTRMRDGAAPHARLGCTDEERVSSERPDVDGDVVPRRVVGELAMRYSDALVLLLHELALAAPRLRPQCPLQTAMSERRLAGGVPVKTRRTAPRGCR